MAQRASSSLDEPSVAPERKAQSTDRLTREEKRAVFKRMVVAELESGFLRYSRREALLKYAKILGFSEFDACLLIAEAQYHAGDLEPIRIDPATSLDTAGQPELRAIPTRLSFALTAAIFIDLLLIYWIFG